MRLGEPTGRRGALFRIGAYTAGTTIGAVNIVGEVKQAVGQLLDYALDVPYTTLETDDKADVSAGSFEAGVDNPIIDKKGNPFPFLFTVAGQNPITCEVTSDFLGGYLMPLLYKRDRAKTGDALAYVVKSAEIALRDKSVSENTSRKLEVGHAAMYGLGTGFSHRLKEPQLKHFGIEITGYKNVSDFYLGPNGMQTLVYPEHFGEYSPLDRLMAVKRKESIYSGPDKTSHLAGFAWAGFMIEYANDRNVPLLKKTPRLLQWAATNTPRKYHGEALAIVGGWLYELAGTLKLPNIPIFGGQEGWEIDEGLFDPTVQGDLAANLLGIRLGQIIYHLISDPKGPPTALESLAPLIEFLNKHSYPKGAEPRINLPGITIR